MVLSGKTFDFMVKKSKTACARKLRKSQNEIRRLRLKVKSYKLRLRQLEKVSVQKNFEKLTENMSEEARLFTRMQCMEGKKMKKGHRFTLDEKILSLSLYKKSPKAYNLMCKHFTLPSKKVLKALLSKIKIHPGINPLIFEELKVTVSKMLPQDRLCTLLFDEMSITPQIHYNPYTDDLVGFENFGTSTSEKFSNHALVFMVKGIKKIYKQPVAYYFVQNLQTNNLKEILKDVVKNVQATGLNIVATVCDQGSPNASCINSLVSEAKEKYLRSGKEWKNNIIIIDGKEIIPLFDVPHLLKGMRNNLLNKDMEYKNENQLKTIKWEYFQRIFEADKSHGELRLLPKLTREHVDPEKIKKMKVKIAAQIFSHSMAVAADNLVARGEVPSECKNIIPFVLLIDNLFDSLNASSFSAPCGKKYRAAVKRNSPHHVIWQKSLELLKSIQFMVKKSDGTTFAKSIPTVNNFIKTVEGFKSLWKLLSTKYGLDSMLTRNINQDPLENFFGSIRSLGARYVAPNCVGFEGAFKTLLLNNLSSNHSVNSNCEEDENKCLQSVSFLLQNKINDTAPSQSHNIVIDQPLNVIGNNVSTDDSGADQRIYVCGWALTKCLQNVIKGCEVCKSKLQVNSNQQNSADGNPSERNTNNTKYRYIKAKEYEKGKEWLCYPAECLVACFQDLQNTTIAFLNSECHKPKLKERIVAFAELFIDFSFIDCVIHKEKLKQCFVNTSINIIIYSWCRSVNRILDGKITYKGEDKIKQTAQLYYDKHKSIKK